MPPPLSRLRARAHVGLDFFDRTAPAPPPSPPGLVDSIHDLAQPEVDTHLVPPAVVAFFEQTGSLELLIRPRWLRGFRLASRLFRALAGRLGQLCMPLAPARVFTRIAPLDDAIDGRPGARACLRSYADGAPMQVVAYATSPSPAGPLLSVAFPFPLCNLNGLLRLAPAGLDPQRRLAVCLTSEPAPGAGDHAGVWLVFPWFRLRTPFGEAMWLWDADSPLVPPDLAPELFPGTTLVSRHEQTLFGVPFARHSYYFRPLEGAAVRAAARGSAAAPGDGAG